MNDFKIEDFKNFIGGWSLSPYAIFLSLKYTNFGENKINILEFGSGDGTIKLINFLKSKNIEFDYTSVEHDINYQVSKEVKYIIYDLPKNYDPSHIENINLNLDKKYDLIIVDGPHGVGRSKWYKKFKDNVKDGTIVLVDDFHHYKEFDYDLDLNFKYELINVFNVDNRFTDKIVNDGFELIDITSPFHNNKTHKIVKIKL